MNKFTKSLWALLPMLSMLILVGCDKPVDGKTDEYTSSINLKATSVEVNANGGNYTVNYTITNPVEGQNVTVNPVEDWITDVDVTTAGVIKFVVERNSDETPRQSVVEVSYKGAEKQTFTVKQLAALGSDLTFEFDLTHAGYFSALIDVYPANQDLAYIYNIYSPAEIEANGLETDEALFAYEWEYFAALGYWYSMSSADVAEERMKYGNQYDVEPTGLVPESTYYLIAYYYDPDTEQRISDISRFEFTTGKVTLSEMDFEIATTVDANLLNVTVTAPTNYYDAFYFDVMEKSVVDTECAQLDIEPARYFELYNNTYVANYLSHEQGATINGYMADFCSYMSDSYEFDCLAETDYYVFAFAVNDSALCATVPVYVEAKTGKVEMSDNEIDIVVKDITKDSATMMWKTTNDDPYTAGYVAMSEWKTYGMNDKMRMQSIVENVGVEIMNGDQKFTPKNPQDKLAPGTEYVVYAFGFRGGVFTTDLFTTTFTTKEDRLSEMEMTVETIGYFDMDAIIALGAEGAEAVDIWDYWKADYAIMPLTINFSDESMLKHFYIDMRTVGQDPFDPNQYISMVTYDGPVSHQRVATFVSYTHPSHILVMAEDKEGYYTNLHRELIEGSRAGVNPNPQLFVDWYKAETEKMNNSGGLVTSLVYDDEVPAIEKFSYTIPASAVDAKKKMSKNTLAEAKPVVR